MVSGFGFDLDISSLTCIFSEPHSLAVTMPQLRQENLRIYTSERRSLARIPKHVKPKGFFKKSIFLHLILKSQLSHRILSTQGLTGFLIGDETIKYNI